MAWQSQENPVHIWPTVRMHYIFLPVWCHRNRLVLYLTLPCAILHLLLIAIPVLLPVQDYQGDTQWIILIALDVFYMFTGDGTCKIDCLLDINVFNTIDGISREATCIYSVHILSLSVCGGGLLWWGLATHCAIRDLRESSIQSLISKGRCPEVK